MNVLVTSHLYPSELSRTAGSFVHNQVRFLQEHAAVRCVVPTPWFPVPWVGKWGAYRRLAHRETVDGVDITRPRYLTLPRRWLLQRAWRSYLGALHRVGFEAEVIHAHCAYPDGLAAVHYGRRSRMPVVITVHGHDLKDLGARGSRWRPLVAEALAGADAVIAVSEELAGRAADLGVPEARLHPIPNGVDGELFRPTGERRPGEGGWELLYVGRFDPAKGMGLLLDAVARLRAGGRPVRARCVGGASATGTAEVFRRQLAELGIADAVDLEDEVTWADLPRIMNRADVFVLPSYSEGLPLSLLEAQACGLPAVTTRCGGPEEVVDDEVGELVAVGDVEALTGALARVLDAYGRFDRQHIGARTRERYDYRQVAARIAAVYEQVAAA